MTVELIPEMQQFVDDLLRRGVYTTESDIIHAALAALQTQESLWEDLDVETMRAKVAVGLEQLERGETVSFTAEDIIRESKFSHSLEGNSRSKSELPRK